MRGLAPPLNHPKFCAVIARSAVTKQSLPFKSLSILPVTGRTTRFAHSVSSQRGLRGILLLSPLRCSSGQAGNVPGMVYLSPCLLSSQISGCSIENQALSGWKGGICVWGRNPHTIFSPSSNMLTCRSRCHIAVWRGG